MSAILTSKKCLVLNKNWTPVGTVTLQDAITKLFSTYDDGTPKARIIEPETFQMFTWEDWAKIRPLADDEKIANSSLFFKIPEIILLSKYEKLPRPKAHFSRRTLYKRDKMTCFPPETLILMDDYSLRSISDVKQGDKVRDAFGAVVTVEYVHTEDVNEPLISIRRRGNGDALLCTSTHRLLPFSWKTGDCLDCDGVEAGKLTVTDYLSELVPDQNYSGNERLDVCLIMAKGGISHEVTDEDTVRLKKTCPSNSVPRYIACDRDFGRLVGYFLAEGSIQRNNVVFTFHSDEREYIEDVKELCKSLFGYECSESTQLDKHVTRVFCCCAPVRVILRHLCYHGGDKRFMDKRFPEPFLRGVLSGVCRGDGDFNEDLCRCTLMMSRAQLVRDIYLIALRLGLTPTLSKCGVRKDGRFYKSVVFQASDWNKLLDVCDLPCQLYTDLGGKRDRKVLGRRLISKITEIKEVPYCGIVYDLQVSGSHTYVANFVCVHNCQYCGAQPGSEELTIDHVTPRSHGGMTTWENCVIACTPCNRKKANRTPKQANMPLRKEPKKPDVSFFRFDTAVPVKSWQSFLGLQYWNIELENDNKD